MSNEKILVVEFEENSLNSLFQVLKTEGFEVVTAKDGHEGLLMFESENPDLVIMEPMLLKLHGFDLCRKISKDSGKKTPVIITTGFYKGEHYKSEAMDTFGAAAFFEKPYDSKDLLCTIHNLLGNGTGKGIEGIKESSPQKKTAEINIDETVREMEKTLKESVVTEKTAEAAKARKGEVEISSAVDELLQGTLSEFGLSIDKKASGEKKAKEERIAERAVEETPAASQAEPIQEVQTAEAEQEEVVGEPAEEGELHTEELIEELIRKEEKIEREEGPGEEISVQKEEEEIEARKEEVKEPIKEDIQTKEIGTEQKVFGDYFEQAERSSFLQTIMGFIKKLRKPIPLMIASTVIVVGVAIAATLYFLKPGDKAQPFSSQQTSQPLSSVERTATSSGLQENLASPQETQDDGDRGASPGSTPVGGDPNALAQKPAGNGAAEEEQILPESTSEFMSVTSLSSNKRQVMLPETNQSPKSREFEIVEVQEAGIEELTESDVNVNATPLEETAKKIIQPENPSDRIKTGDLVPIETVDILPVATKKTNPKYPPYAFQRGIEATVVFRALISEFGNVLDIAFVDTSRSATPFNKACEEAVREWKFMPAKKNGVNVKVWKTFSISFKKNKTE
jgi:TonB family protein